MARDTFELEIEIRAEPRAVHAFLGDLHGYRALHPLIEEIHDLEPTAEHPDARRYRVVDRLSLGPLRFRTAYTAELRIVSDSEIHGHAWQSPGVELHAVYRVAPSPGGTRLAERTTVCAPRLLRGWVRREAEAAHRATLANLKAHLERGAGSAAATHPPAC